MRIPGFIHSVPNMLANDQSHVNAIEFLLFISLFVGRTEAA